MILAYSFPILDENSKKILIHRIERPLKEASISYEIKESINVEIWILNKEDLYKVIQICQKESSYNQEIHQKIKKKKIIKKNYFSSYGLVTLIILGCSLFIGIQINLTKNKESILNSPLNEKPLKNNLTPLNSKKDFKWIGIYNYFFLKKSYPQTVKNYYFKFFHLNFIKNIWFLFIPSFIHLSLLATFFNCFWFALLGNSIEIKIGKIKFFLFVLVLGLSTNFFQYVMTGPSFYGLSGIISGLVSFILVRKKEFPWEAYNIQKETLFFIIFCISASVVLQSIITLARISGKATPFLQIPNTALLSGLLIGYLTGKSKFMQIKEL